MIFASDLDQTLIYSKKFISDPLTCCMHPVRLIETNETEEISFMTETAINKLKELSNKVVFVPVTTRTISQYRRIQLFQNEIKPKYAVVSNGGNVVIDGNIDEDWKNSIKSMISFECLSSSEVLQEFCKISNDNWVLSQRTADDLFLYFITDQTVIPHDELDCFGKWVTNNGWTISLQGRKLYLVPNCINKWSAISYVRELAGASKISAAGDSLLDLCMLEKSDFAITPMHGEIARTIVKNSKIQVTEMSGIYAADEILEKINKQGLSR